MPPFSPPIFADCLTFRHDYADALPLYYLMPSLPPCRLRRYAPVIAMILRLMPFAADTLASPFFIIAFDCHAAAAAALLLIWLRFFRYFRSRLRYHSHAAFDATPDV